MTVKGVPLVAVESRWDPVVSDLEGAVPAGRAASVVVAVQWEPPSAQDLQSVVGQFQLTYDPVARQPVIDPLPEAYAAAEDRATRQAPISAPGQSPDDSEG